MVIVVVSRKMICTRERERERERERGGGIKCRVCEKEGQTANEQF